MMALDPEMRPALPLVQHLIKNFASANSKFAPELWNQVKNTIGLLARTTNACENFHSILNSDMFKRTSFFQIVARIELFIISVEDQRTRVRGGKALDTMTNRKRFNKELAIARAMKAFLLMNADVTIQARAKSLFRHDQIRLYVGYQYEIVHAMAKMTVQPTVQIADSEDDDVTRSGGASTSRALPAAATQSV